MSIQNCSGKQIWSPLEKLRNPEELDQNPMIFSKIVGYQIIFKKPSKGEML
jgi:hypothetical protein